MKTHERHQHLCSHASFSGGLSVPPSSTCENGYSALCVSRSLMAGNGATGADLPNLGERKGVGDDDGE